MKYAKLINFRPSFAPNPIIVDDVRIGNPPASLLLEQGYKPVIFTDPPEPEPGFIAVPHWEETEVMGDAVIAQIWILEPEPDEVDGDRAMQILFEDGDGDA